MPLYCLNPACPSPQNPNTHQYCQGCGQALAQTTLGYQFRDRYHVIQPLGEGTFGRTYLVEDLNFRHKKRVLKKFIAAVQGKALETAQELFRREAETLDTLKHDQIPAIYDHFEVDNSLYLVEEYIDGENLITEFSEMGVFSEEKIVVLLQDLLPVLEYLHQRKLLHRDIKPDNIIRRRQDNKLVLIDFGGVKEVSQTRGTLIYTPGYASIEQMTGHPQPASDIYSLGATCIRLLTGCFPLENQQNDPIYDSHTATWLWREILHNQGREIEQNLGNILDKMLQHLGQDRYQNAQEVLQALNLSLNPSQSLVKIEASKPVSQKHRSGLMEFLNEREKQLNYAALGGLGIIISWCFKFLMTSSSFQSLTVWEKLFNYVALLSAVMIIIWIGKRLINYFQQKQKTTIAPTVLTAPSAEKNATVSSPTSQLSQTISQPSPPPKQPQPKTKPKKNRVSSLKTCQFSVITVDKKGEIIQQSKQENRYFTVNLGKGISLDMVVIKGGKFFMGCPHKESRDNQEQKPRHWVILPSFCMGKYPITQAQWEIIMNYNPSYFKGHNRPIESVSWYECLDFCQNLSQDIGIQFTLPSESQWEYACRGIINPEQYRGLDGEETYPPFHFGETITSEFANYNSKRTYQQESLGIYRQQTTDVGRFFPNAFGLYDMHGNVWEWCADTWHNNYKNAPTDGSIWLNGDDENSPMRGGSWGAFPAYCRSATRSKVKRNNRSQYNGFRVVYNFGKS